MTTPLQSPFLLKGAARLCADDGTPLPIAKPSTPEFVEAGIGYLKQNFLLHFPQKTGLRSSTPRANLKTFPDLSLLTEPEYTAIFDSYTLADLRTIRKDISKLLTKVDLEMLQQYHTIYIEDIRNKRIALQQDLDAAADPDADLLDAIEGFELIITPLSVTVPVITISTPVAVTPPVVTPPVLTSSFCHYVKNRSPCTVSVTVQTFKRNDLATYQHLVLEDIEWEEDYLRWRGQFISFLDQPSTYLDATELIHSNFILRIQKEYGLRIGNTSFKFTSPAWDYFQLITVLDVIYWPTTDIKALVLSDFEQMKMVPVTDIFTRESLSAYRQYFGRIDLYCIKNEDMLKSVPEKLIVNAFIKYLSFNPNILNLSEKLFPTLVDCLVPVKEYIDTQVKNLKYTTALPILHHQVNNVQIREQSHPSTSKKDKVNISRRIGCWNCEGRTLPAGKPHGTYWNCPLVCRGCGVVTCAGECTTFKALIADRQAAVDAARAARASAGKGGPKKVHTLLGSSHISSIISPIRVLYTNSIPSDIPTSLPIIDSGATFSCVNNRNLIAPNTFSLPTTSGIVTLSDSTTSLSIEGEGQFIAYPSLPVKYVPQLGENLICVADLVDSGNIVVFDHTSMYCITCSDEVLSKYNELVNYSKNNDLLSLTSFRSSDKLYRLDMSPPTTPIGRVDTKKSFPKKKVPILSL